MRPNKFVIAAFMEWLVALLSLLGVHFLLNRKSASLGVMTERAGFFEGLSDALKTSIRRYDSAPIQLADEKFHLIGYGFEGYERSPVELEGLMMRQLNPEIADPIALERKMIVGEEIRTLNNADDYCWDFGPHTYCYFWCYWSGNCIYWSQNPVHQVCAFN